VAIVVVRRIGATAHAAFEQLRAKPVLEHMYAGIPPGATSPDGDIMTA
jgi:hypothetical protein